MWRDACVAYTLFVHSSEICGRIFITLFFLLFLLLNLFKKTSGMVCVKALQLRASGNAVCRDSRVKATAEQRVKAPPGMAVDGCGKVTRG